MTMQHPDEKTLSLYAMGADLPGDGTAMVGDHLRSCAGCREQVEDLQSINGLVAERSSGPPSAPPYSIEAIDRVARTTRRMHFSPSRRSPRHMVTRVQRAVWFVRSHPVVSGAGTLLLGIALFSLAIQIKTYRLREEQPSYLRMNSIATAVCVFNEDGKELFRFPVSPKGLTDISDLRYIDIDSRIVDLDDDGNAEIITGAPFGEGATYTGSTIRIYAGNGVLKQQFPLGIPVRYGRSDYQNSFFIHGIRVWERDGRKGLLISLNNNRSPSCLVRTDSDGRIVGEYWHFGWMSNPELIRIPGFDHDLILLNGGDDSHSLEGRVSPSFTVLDPDSIIGRMESTVTPGFGFPRSTAEIIYMQAGHADPSFFKTQFERHLRFDARIRYSQDGSFTFLASGLKGLTEFGLMYTFDPGFAIREVWSSDYSRMMLTEHLLKDGTAEGVKAFFDHMKSLVRYWDGREWQPLPVRVRHTIPPA
jgi:hypothetical protein